MVTKKMLHPNENRAFLFGEKVTALDLIKCIRQIKYQRLLLTCAPISKLPSNISAMIWSMSCYGHGPNFIINTHARLNSNFFPCKNII